MLCYRHWLSHQTTETNILDDQQEMDQLSSSLFYFNREREKEIYTEEILIVTLDSDIDEQENVSDVLKECINQDQDNEIKPQM